jgi:hypothetical protein
VESFLRARLDEEAQAAREAITHSSTAHFTVSAEVAAHIGRWDPARVRLAAGDGETPLPPDPHLADLPSLRPWRGEGRS